MSFIKESQNGDKMATSDILLVLVVVIGGLGLWWYTSSSKSQSFEAFAAAEQLVEEKKYEEAFDAWFELQKISYKSDSLDSLLYDNLSFLEELKDGNLKNFRSIDSLLKASPINNVKIQQKLKLTYEPYFFKPEQSARVSEWRKRFGVPLESIEKNTSNDSTSDSTSAKAAPVSEEAPKAQANESAKKSEQKSEVKPENKPEEKAPPKEK